MTQTNTTYVSTFQSPVLGASGSIVAGRPAFFRGAPGPGCGPRRFDVSQLETLPRVDIIHAHAGMSGDIVEALLERGARGLVLAGVGNGNASHSALDALAAATRTGSGFVSRNVEVDDDARGFVKSGDLNPQKARVLQELFFSR